MMSSRELGSWDPEVLPIVVIGLITCRNPVGLEKSLSHLLKQHTRFPYQIIVVDNDRDMAGKAVVENVVEREGGRVIEYYTEPASGIPFARNHLVSAFLNTDAEFLVMYDDDEYPAVSWLENIVATSIRTGADIVGGPVEAVLDGLAEKPLFASDYNKHSGKVKKNGALVESTANLLLTRRVLQAFDGEWFRGAFAHTGGSDTDFLRRTAVLGYPHALAPDALVFEDVPKSRLTTNWWRKRAFRSGGSLVVARRMNYGLFRTLAFETASIAYLMIVGLGRLIFSRIGSRRRHEASLMIARGQGKMAAIMGRRYNEYSQSNYR